MSDWWNERNWRLIQTNLREIDMLDIDAEQVVADLRSFRANVLMINAAGIIASYPTDLPFHFQSPYLQGDSLQQIIAACHTAGIRVIARTDFSKVRRPIYEQHPEWAYISPKGEIVDYNGDVAVCLNGEYQQEYALEIIRELLSTHDFDGIFFNMGGFQTRDYSGNYYGLCHCASCQRRFREVTWFEKEDGTCRLLHLVNGSGHYGTSFFAPVPMTDLEVGVPCPQKPAKVRDLADRQDCEFSWMAGQLKVRVPRLGLFAALAVEFAE